MVGIGGYERDCRQMGFGPIAQRLVASIPTRCVSEGFSGIVRPSLTLRVGMFPLPAANLLSQQAVTLRVGIKLLLGGKSIHAPSRYV